VLFRSLAQALTLDVILHAVLGVSDTGMRRRLREIFDSMATPVNNIALLVPQLVRRSRWNLPAKFYWRLKDQLDALLSEHIVATRADPGLAGREDVLAMMVAARDEHGKGLSDGQLRDELITLIMAGHETTATAIAWALELLTHNPAILARARDGDEDYLEALAKETLRIRSPVPIGAGREVLEPFTVGRWTIPAGTAIFVNAYGVHHDPDVHPEPEVFRPERFLGEPTDSYSFLPFGGGAHRCLGAGLAQLEITVVVGEILKRFELAAAAGAPARPARRGVTLAPRGGARVRIVAERQGAYASDRSANATAA
jgi:cytochrome P450